jgi:4-hydroxy-tetrahydrodipicolinate synthase
MIDLAQAGDIDGARVVDAGLQELFRALAVTTNPIPIKAAMNLMGFDAGGLRLPLVQADEAETRVVAAALEAAGLLSVSA